VSDEFAVIRRIAARFSEAAAGELWIGDDAAIVRVGAGVVAVAADALVVGVHADLSFTTLADFGWKALAVNVSDLAAMGVVAMRALVTVSAPPGTDIDALYDGIADASQAMECPIVGGDLTTAPELVVSVTVLGDAAVEPPPVTRAGAGAGDAVWVSGPLGAAAAALRERRADPAHARPVPRTRAGVTARELGATAMIDVSDGFAADLGHVLDASRVGVELDAVPVAAGATAEDAIGGGDDYELVWCCPSAVDVVGEFARRQLDTPTRVGEIVADPSRRLLAGRALGRKGWVHQVG
jgi:thiamine-monophosphate kinase